MENPLHLTNEIVAVVYFVVAALMPLLGWYTARAEAMSNDSWLPWKPFPPTIGWWLVSFLMSLFILFTLLGFAVLVAPTPVYWWGLFVTVTIGVTAIGLFFAFAKAERDSWNT